MQNVIATVAGFILTMGDFLACSMFVPVLTMHLCVSVIVRASLVLPWLWYYHGGTCPLCVSSVSVIHVRPGAHSVYAALDLGNPTC